MTGNDFIKVSYKFGSAVKTKEGFYKDLKDWIDSLDVQYNIIILKSAEIPNTGGAALNNYKLVRNNENPVYKYKNPIDR